MTKETTLPLYATVKHHFSVLADSYDQKAVNRSNYLARIDDIAVSQINSSGISRPLVLDAGTGTGTRLARIKNRITSSEMFAIDVSSNMMAHAKGKDIDGLAVADMACLPFSDATFDYVFCFFNAFGYVPSQARRMETLKEFRRVLKPSGVVIIDVLNRWHTGEGINFKKTKRQISTELSTSRKMEGLEEGDVLFNLHANGSALPGYFHSFTKTEANTTFRQAGFFIDGFHVIGYDSGQSHHEISKGNFLYILKKS